MGVGTGGLGMMDSPSFPNFVWERRCEAKLRLAREKCLRAGAPSPNHPQSTPACETEFRSRWRAQPEFGHEGPEVKDFINGPIHGNFAGCILRLQAHPVTHKKTSEQMPAPRAVFAAIPDSITVRAWPATDSGAPRQSSQTITTQRRATTRAITNPAKPTATRVTSIFLRGKARPPALCGGSPCRHSPSLLRANGK